MPAMQISFGRMNGNEVYSSAGLLRPPRRAPTAAEIDEEWCEWLRHVGGRFAAAGDYTSLAAVQAHYQRRAPKRDAAGNDVEQRPSTAS